MGGLDSARLRTPLFEVHAGRRLGGKQPAVRRTPVCKVLGGLKNVKKCSKPFICRII